MLTNSEFNDEWKWVNENLQEHLSKAQNEEKFEDISYEAALELDSSYHHSAHAFLWCKNDKKLWGYDLRASILMQMRFDGSIGFPGGLIDPTDDSWEDGLNRELQEELNMDESFKLNKGHYLFSQVHRRRMNVLHFYAKEYSPTDYSKLEADVFQSVDFGGEVMGIIRPPLLKTKNNRGFSVFIKNKFIGTALTQLLKTIILLKIIPFEDLQNILSQPIVW